MPVSLPVSLASTALLLLPLSVRCVPLELVARQDDQSASAITQTIMSTYFLTTTMTTYMTLSSTPTESSTTSIVSPISDTVVSTSSVVSTDTVTISAQAVPSSDTVVTTSTSSTELPTASTTELSTTSTTDVVPSSTDASTSSSSLSALPSDSTSSSTPTPTITDSLSLSPSPSPSSSDPSPTPTPTSNSTDTDPSIFTPGANDNKRKTPPPLPAQRLVMAYYPDWVTADFPPEKIDFQRLDWIDFAFAVPDANLNLNWDGSDDAPAMLQRLVTVAHGSGKHVKLSVGGWSGSKYFSTACSTSTNRQKLANNILALYNQFHLDGIDIDWEYPGQPGNEGNVISPSDSANYLLFLQTLRKMLPATAKITAATMTVPFADSQGNPMKDVSAFAQVLDWILIMNYDTWGSSSNPGPNAPLNDACGNSTQSSASALAAVKAWTNAGFPASQIVLGVPSYGYISRSSAQTLHTRRSLPEVPSHPLYASRNTVRTPRTPHPRGIRNRVHKRSHHHVRRSSHNHSIGRRRLLEYTELPPTQPSIPNFNLPAANPDSETLQQPAVEHLIDPTEIDQSDDTTSDTAVTNVSNQQQDSAAVPPGTTIIQNEDGGVDNGQVQFRDLLKQGVLLYIPDYDATEYASANMNASALTFAGRRIENWHTGYSGFTRQWDGCSNTPFLRGGNANQVVSYDDPQSLEMKGMFAKEAGLLGVNMFDVHGDTDHWDLTDAVRRGLGLS